VTGVSQDARWRGASPTPYWLDDPARPPARPALDAELTCDLAVVGAGYSGLWTALLAKERDPDRDVVVMEAVETGWAASGRNGGFCEASLTHGAANGRERYRDEFETLQRLGRANLAELVATVQRYGIDCDLEPAGQLSVATEPYQVAELRAAAELGDGELLDTAAVRSEVASPTYLAGLWDRDGTVLVHPARLAWGLAAACESRGVRIYERTPVRRLSRRDARLLLETPGGVPKKHRREIGRGRQRRRACRFPIAAWKPDTPLPSLVPTRRRESQSA
jgi:glycine/D-amino acid oxidase-like deaminating enzyme